MNMFSLSENGISLDKLSLIISSLAFLVSFCALYFDVWYESNEVLVRADLRIIRDEKVIVQTTFINTGNRDAIVYSCNPAILALNSGRYVWQSLKSVGDQLEPFVIESGQIKHILCEAFLTPSELYLSEYSFQSSSEEEGLRRLLLGLSVTAVDSNGQEWTAYRHLLTEHFTKSTTVRGQYETSVFELYSKRDALSKNWSYLGQPNLVIN